MTTKYSAIGRVMVITTHARAAAIARGTEGSRITFEHDPQAERKHAPEKCLGQDAVFVEQLRGVDREDERSGQGDARAERAAAGREECHRRDHAENDAARRRSTWSIGGSPLQIRKAVRKYG